MHPTSQVDAGFLEGIVRGYKAGLLTQNQYNNLTQCESIEGAFTSFYFLNAVGTYYVPENRLQNTAIRDGL